VSRTFETEGETDRHTALLVDHRAHTGESATEETPLEYIREAALAMTASAVGHSDPLSLWTVGDDGLTETLAAGSTPAAYTRVRSTLLGLPQRRRRQTIGRHQLAGYRRLSSHWTSRHRLDKRYNGTERGRRPSNRSVRMRLSTPSIVPGHRLAPACGSYLSRPMQINAASRKHQAGNARRNRGPRVDSSNGALSACSPRRRSQRRMMRIPSLNNFVESSIATLG